ncbi:hypothetical protein V4D30_00405 [Thermodesulfovibrio sp. 3907-1M]|uniref:Uncharacterized protein n=1 Tax=Thermodesulfovibrio autotrophicus TaxID=3118333 RepID=A0AAU8GWN2_9BACT
MKIIKQLLFVLLGLSLLSSAFAAEKRYSLPLENSPYIGYENAPVTIVEFIDYQ